MSTSGRKNSAQNSQPAVPKSSIKRGQETVMLTDEDLFDKIINLRFIHKPTSEGALPRTFTIRSDYEVVYTKTGYYYVDCVQKPSIKIEYKQVANDTVIELNIDVTNLFIKDMTSLERSSGDIQQVEIQMGYKSQMPDLARNEVFKGKSLHEFMALPDFATRDGLHGKTLPTRITAQVLTTQRLSTPPDMVTRFQCVVGTLEQGLRWMFDEESLNADIKNQKSSKWVVKPNNELPGTFFSLITRRFIRSSVPHDITDVVTTKMNSKTNKMEEVIEQRVTIYDDDYKTVLSLTDKLENGRLSMADADTYGTYVYLSRVLWELPISELPMWNLTDAEVKQTNPILYPNFAELYDKVPAQLNAIVKQYPFIRFYVLSSGDYYAYHVKEKEKELFADPFVNDRQKKRIFKLPAVYDVTWSGTRQIRAPFFPAIGSMDTVAFQSKYVLNDVAGNFYKPQPKNNCYLVLLADIVFSTTGKENMMTLTCTDIEGEYEPQLLTDGSIQPGNVPEILPVQERLKTWKLWELEVTFAYKGDPNTTDNSWMTLVKRLLNSAKEYAGRWGSPGPTADDVLDMIHGVTANAALFSPSRISDAVTPESQLFGRNLPVIYGKEHNPFNPGFGDKIWIKYPLLPNYPPEEQIL